MRNVLMLSFVVPALLLAFAAAAAEPAAGAKGSIKGKVLNADGKPAAGVAVRLTHRGEGKTEGKPGTTGNANGTATEPHKGKKEKGTAAGAPGKSQSVAETTADANGEFTFSDVAPGKYVVAARAKASGAGRESVTVTASTPATVTVKLKAGKGKGDQPQARAHHKHVKAA